MPPKPPFQFELISLVLLITMTATALGAFGPWGLLLALICALIVAWARVESPTGLPRKGVAAISLITIGLLIAFANDRMPANFEADVLPPKRIADWLAPILFALVIAAMLFRPQRKRDS
jgi:hypothetical protein